MAADAIQARLFWVTVFAIHGHKPRRILIFNRIQTCVPIVFFSETAPQANGTEGSAPIGSRIFAFIFLLILLQLPRVVAIPGCRPAVPLPVLASFAPTYLVCAFALALRLAFAPAILCNVPLLATIVTCSCLYTGTFCIAWAFPGWSRAVSFSFAQGIDVLLRFLFLLFAKRGHIHRDWYLRDSLRQVRDTALDLII